MSSNSIKHYVYKYRDLAGQEHGPFQPSVMSKWYKKGGFDDEITIYQYSDSTKVNEYQLGAMRQSGNNPFPDEVPETNTSTADEQNDLETVEEKHVLLVNEEESAPSQCTETVFTPEEGCNDAPVTDYVAEQVLTLAETKDGIREKTQEMVNIAPIEVAQRELSLFEQNSANHEKQFSEVTETTKRVLDKLEAEERAAEVFHSKSVKPSSFEMERNTNFQTGPITEDDVKMNLAQVKQMKFSTNDSLALRHLISPKKEIEKKKKNRVDHLNMKKVDLLSEKPTVPTSDKLETSSQNEKPSESVNYPSHPFMRLPDPEDTLVTPEVASYKVFSLYQLIITVPDNIKHFPPFDKETVCCQMCQKTVKGRQMFDHLISIQHLRKASTCMFSEKDIDFWINRVHEVIRSAPAKALSLPEFTPRIGLMNAESPIDFINRTKGFAKKLNVHRLEKPCQLMFINVVLNQTAATQYCFNPSSIENKKVSGEFLSSVVEILIGEVVKDSFERFFGSLRNEWRECTFCNAHFDIFYDACCHVGSEMHRKKIKNLRFDENLVVMWIRLLMTLGKRQTNEFIANEIPEKKAPGSIDVVTID